jgi:hypothetical protein
VEQTKLPEFFGHKGKDNITAIVFIQIIDDLARTNWWTDTATYANVANTLNGFARDWLFAIVEMLDWTTDQLTWTNLKPRFQRQFATQTDEKMIIEGLSNLAMKPGESTRELLARITNTMVILKESYASYEKNLRLRPTMMSTEVSPCHEPEWRDEALNNAQQFLKMQIFRAALPAELQKVVAQRNPNTLTLDDMYQIATDTQREAGPRIKQAVVEINPESASAFQKKKNSKNTDRKKNSNPMSRTGSKGYSSNYKSNTGPGSNANRNGKYCSYCKLQNHTQEDCFKRIRDKKPCKDRQGCAYRPRVYLTDNSDPQHQGQQPVFHLRA